MNGPCSSSRGRGSVCAILDLAHPCEAGTCTVWPAGELVERSCGTAACAPYRYRLAGLGQRWNEQSLIDGCHHPSASQDSGGILRPSLSRHRVSFAWTHIIRKSPRLEDLIFICFCCLLEVLCGIAMVRVVVAFGILVWYGTGFSGASLQGPGTLGFQ